MEESQIDWMGSLKEISIALAHTEDAILIERFLGSILTKNETDEIAKRWELVKLIAEGYSQRAVSKELGLSLCKITRGSRELKKENSAFAAMIDVYHKVSGKEKKEADIG